MESKKIITNSTVLKRTLFFLLALFSPVWSWAATEHATTSSAFYGRTFIVLLCIALLLLVVILVLVSAVKSAAKWCEDKNSKNSGIIKTVVVLIACTVCTQPAFSQTDSVSVSQGSAYGGLDPLLFFSMIALIAFEIYVAFMLRNLLMQLLGANEYKKQLAVEKAKVKKPTLIEKLNASVAIEEEADIMLDHEYDGIRELDNNLPPWWKYGFYVTIVFACVYLVHYHVFKTGRLQVEEYNAEMHQAKIDLDAYMKKAANLVNENNVTLLTDGASISEGKSIFQQNCSTCHGKAGEGGVGPNLTDDYWLHGGNIGSIFATVKYGYPEKGMKSWQQDLGARQIHVVASFIKSIHGTNPPHAKAKQGELYKEAAVEKKDKDLVKKAGTKEEK
jgi:cytochrome c oxidase cbb3-type subunit 3